MLTQKNDHFAKKKKKKNALQLNEKYESSNFGIWHLLVIFSRVNLGNHKR